MRNLGSAVGSALFCALLWGTVGCGTSGKSGQSDPDASAPGKFDTTVATPDTTVALTSDASMLLPDTRTGVIPDAWLVSPDLATLNPDSSSIAPDSNLPDSNNTLSPETSSTDPDAIAQGDTSLSSVDADAGRPDSIPDGRLDSVPVSNDTNSPPVADAAAQFGKTVTFSNGRAVGAMVDWGWVSGGNSSIGGGNSETPLTTFTQPVCPPGSGALTGFSQSCNSIQWPTTNALCMSGNIPAVTACVGGLATVATTAGPVTAQCLPDETMDYGEDWGAMVGVQATPEKKSTITFTPTSMAVTFTGAPTTSAIRLMITIDSISYCTYAHATSYISGTVVTAADFSNQCWTTGGVAPASLAGIQKVMLQIDSKTTPVAFSNFCFTGVVFE